MELTQGQSLALRAIEEVSKSHPDGGGIVIINGFAGTGKTTLLRTLAEGERLLVLAPTGKAAMRAMEVAPVKAMTIHRWLYEVAEDPRNGKLVTAIRQDVEIPDNRTVIVDEASMVTFKMYRDLYQTCRNNRLNLIFIGDGFQLPPVELNENLKNFSVFASDVPAHYRVQMTEVVRQALDSPIIRASMDLRDLTSNMGEIGCLTPVKVSDLSEAAAEVFNDGGATICQRNVTRHALNNDIRGALGITGEKLVKGEPLMILFNNYNLDVYNGEIATVLDEPKLIADRPVPVTDRYVNESQNMWFYRTRIETPMGRQSVLYADREVFGSSGAIGMKFIRRAGQDQHRNIRVGELRSELGKLSVSDLKGIQGDEVINANLGYSLTAWKAQGSEWPVGIVCVEPTLRLASVDGRKFMYTAVTRFKREVRLCWM